MPPRKKTTKAKPKPKTKPKTPIAGKDAKGMFTPGNLFAIGCATSGQPPKFKTAKALIKKIAEYLDYEDRQRRPDSFSKAGKGIYTLSGCALYLGFASRQSMDDQSKRGAEFSDVINKFKLFLVAWNEQKLYWGGTYMAGQFWLRNHGGYSEESSVTQQQTITLVQPVVKSTGLAFANNEADIKD